MVRTQKDDIIAMVYTESSHDFLCRLHKNFV